MTCRKGACRVPGMDDFLTKDEAAEFLRVNVRTLGEWVQRGEVPAAKVGRRLVFSRAQLADWLRDKAKAEQAERRGA